MSKTLGYFVRGCIALAIVILAGCASGPAPVQIAELDRAIFQQTPRWDIVSQRGMSVLRYTASRDGPREYTDV